MKRILCIVAIVLFAAESSFAGKICLQDNFGGYWELKGGRADKKTYTAKLIVPGFCVVGGYADATQASSSTLLVSLFNAHDTGGQCNPVLFSATTNIQFAGSGKYDTLADGSVEGTFTLTSIKCSTMPAGFTIRSVAPTDHPAVRKQ